MKKSSLVESNVIRKLIDLNTDFADKGSCVAWTTFPYNKLNLRVVKNSIKKLNWQNDEYILTFDENLIFVERDIIIL